LLSSDLVALNSANEFSGKENYQQIQEDFIAPNYYEDTHDFFQKEQESYYFINKTNCMKQQPCLLNQLEIVHEYHNPIVDWMESISSKVPNVVAFSMLLICNSKYKLLMEFLLCISYSFHIFSNNCIKNNILLVKCLLGCIGSFLIHYQVGFR
jgi:hypothetical protein